jgi:hypothetical protein
MISTYMVRSRSHSAQGRKAEPRRGLLGRCTLVGLALFVFQIYSLDVAESQTIKVNTLKQITFHKMNYNFEQFYCLDEIVYLESRWNYKAKNPKSSAYGLFQILKSKEKDPIKQIDNGLKYINARYQGCACTALAHHKKNGWY